MNLIQSHRNLNYKQTLLLVCMLLMCFYLNAQDNLLSKKISLNYPDISIDNALDSIAQKAGCYFTYNADLFKNSKSIHIHAENEKLSSVLRRLIPDKRLSFHVIDKHIILIPPNQRTELIPEESVIPYISYRKLSGTVTDISGKQVLPYTSIGIRGKHVGTISNQDGKFSLTLSSDNLNDTLVFSYIGYQNSEIKVTDISDNHIHIKLKKDFISLQEVIIRSNDPVSLINAAVNRISENYPQKPANLTSFYRESVLKNNKYMIYLESVLDIYKSSYANDLALERVKVFKSRKIYDVTRLDTISFRLKGGIQGCLKLDIVKNLPEFLDPELRHLYRYRLADISTYNNSSVYIIEFKPKPNLSEPFLQGKIYLETGSLAIVRAEFGYERHRLSELKDRFIVKGDGKTKVKPLIVDYIVSYRDIKGKYFLNHTFGNLKFKVKNKKKLFSNNFSTSFEMATTKFETENVVKFKYRETIRPTTIFSNHKPNYDPNFWGKSNYIKPEENIQAALKRINNSMQQVALGNIQQD